MLLLAAAVLALVSLTLPAGALDEGLYARLLEQHTVATDDIASTRVDYAALRRSEAWEALLRSLAASDPARLGSRDAKLAFWINAYNILAIEMVRAHGPVDGIRSIGSFLRPVWKMEAGRVGGRSVTLHEIEHEILRPMGEPRIHGAIVCASLSCPPLRREPYRAAQLGAQLEDNVRRWLADPRKGARVDRGARTLHLSPIFDWFEEDFDEGVLVFVADHLAAEDARWIRANEGTLRVRYLDYDWSLNAVESSSAAAAYTDEQARPAPSMLGGCRRAACQGHRPYSSADSSAAPAS